MSVTALKKAAMSSAFPAAAGLFEQLAGLFTSPSPHRKPKLETRQLDASLKALQQAPADEIAAVSRILEEVSARVLKLNESLTSIDKVNERGDTKAPATAGTAARDEDAMVLGLLARAPADPADFDLTAGHANAEVMSRLRRESAAALQRRIDSKELLPPKEFQEALGISRQSINEAVKARRMFALLGPGGEYYYPAFYADGDLHRREVEKVAKLLDGVPAASKYHFFTSKSTYLGGVTPLQALKRGRLNDVLIAATALGER